MKGRIKLSFLMMGLIILSLFVFLERENVYEASLDPENTCEVLCKDKGPAPDFRLKSLEGREVSLKDYKGKNICINFFVTWQEFSRDELSALERLKKENKDLEVLLINVREDREIVEEFISREGYELPVLLDETGEIGMDYFVGELPTSYFIDKNGSLVNYSTGLMSYKDMNSIVKLID